MVTGNRTTSAIRAGLEQAQVGAQAATDEASLAEERERIACLLAVNHLPPKALPELSETLSKMFEFYDEKDHSVPTSPISDSVKAIITSEVVHPTFRLDDEP